MKMLSVYLISASLLTACTSNSDNFEKFWAEKRRQALQELGHQRGILVHK